MAVILFIHGVATRDGPDYQRMVEARDRRFREVAFAGDATILNPYWGDFGADPAWDLTCVPEMAATFETLGIADNAADEGTGSGLVGAARANFPAMVAALSVEDLADKEASGTAQDVAEAERFWAAAARYADQMPEPAWLEAVGTDDELLAELKHQVQPAMAPQDLGIFSGFGAAAGRIAGAISNTANQPFARIARERISPMVAIFIGDVFRYLKERQPRQQIRETVVGSLREAALHARQHDEKLIVIGHSLGGVILYDLLSDVNGMAGLDQALGFGFRADLLLTVGSQVGLFEELKVFTASSDVLSGARPAPDNRVARPARVERWWNAFDRMDVLSFLVGPVFREVEDFEVDTIASVLGAHSAYFSNMLFYERLHRRLSGAGLL